MSLITAILLLLVLASFIGGGLGYFGGRYKSGIGLGVSALLLIVLIALLFTGRT
jgi:hypothetical protein